MPDEAVKRRQDDAKKSAMKDYEDRHYKVLPSDNTIICFSAVSCAGTHEIKVRVCVDRIKDRDRELIFALRVPANQSKEIMCRPYKRRGWIRELYDHLNNLCQ